MNTRKWLLVTISLLTIVSAIYFLPHYVETCYHLAVTYDEAGHHKFALTLLKHILWLKPDEARAHYSLGIVYNKLHHPQEAIEPFREAIRLKPDFSLAYHELGATYGDLNRNAEAATSFEQVIRLTPMVAVAHYNLGLIYVRLGNRRAAWVEQGLLTALNRDLARSLFHYLLNTAPLPPQGDDRHTFQERETIAYLIFRRSRKRLVIGTHNRSTNSICQTPPLFLRADAPCRHRRARRSSANPCFGISPAQGP